MIVINDLILAELIPFLRIKREKEVIGLLNTIQKVEINKTILKTSQINVLASNRCQRTHYDSKTI